MRLILAWLLCLLTLAAVPAHAALPPRPEGPILDQADLLPPGDEQALELKLRDYTARSGRALMVATVSSLDGQDIATYGSSLGQKWGVGGASTDQGLIFLVAPNERKVRIEVGYGLEEFLPDVLASRIIRDTVTPRFKAGDFPGGIEAGVDAVITQLERTPADAKAVAEAAAAAQSQAGRQQESSSFGGVIFWIILIVFLTSMFGGRRRRRRRGFGGGALAPIILWDAMSHGRGGGFGGGGFGGGGFGGGGGGWGGFGGGGFGGGGASGSW